MVRRVRQGDPNCLQVIREAARATGLVLGNVINLLNPDYVVVVGYLADVEEVAKPEVENVIAARPLRIPRAVASLSLLPADPLAGARGAAALALSRAYPFLEGPRWHGQRV